MGFNINPEFIKIKASGSNGFVAANEELGTFTGKIISLTEINNNNAPTLKGKLVIKVESKEPPFEDLININDSGTKEDYERSINYLQGHIKSALAEANKQVNYDEQWDFNEIIEHIKNDLIGCKIQFTQFKRESDKHPRIRFGA